MTFTPYPFQEADQKTLAENNYRALLAIEPGGGKTAAALLAHKNSGSRVTLVVAPEATHKSAWVKDAKEILGITPRVIGNTGLKAVKEAMADFKLGYGGIYLVTPQLLTREKDLEMWAGDLLIVDEGHMLNKPGGAGQEQMQRLTETFPKRLFLSGTAWRNNFERAWSVMRFLWPELYKREEVAYDSQWLWMRDRMMFEETEIPPKSWYPTTWEKLDKYREQGFWWKKIGGVPHVGKPRPAKKWLNESEPGRLLSEAPCAIIHKKREECCEFHTVERQGYAGFLNLEEPQVIEHVMELTSKQKRSIKELEKQYLTYLGDNPLIVELPITMQQRLRQMSLGEPEVETYTVTNEDGEEVEKQKLWWKEDCKSPFYEKLKDILESDEEEPMVVYLESQSFASVLTKRLNKDGFSAFEFSGATKKQRDKDLAGFGTKYRVAVIVISAGGTGLDGLQKVSKTEVWFERSVDETNNTQARSRQDRLGGRGQVQRHILVDSDGRASGNYSEALIRQLALNSTLRITPKTSTV